MHTIAANILKSSGVLGGSSGALAGPSAASAPGAGPNFADLISPRDTGLGRTPPSRDQAARKAAQQLVSTTLVKPLLEQMHKDPFKSKLFHGGQAEDMFSGQLDTILADRVTSKADFSIVGAVQRAITRNTGQQSAAASAVSLAKKLPVPSMAAPQLGSRINAHG